MVSGSTLETPRPEREARGCAMGLPHVTSFCCCFGLEVGAKLVAFLHLLVSVCLVVVASVYAAKFGEVAGTAEDAGDGVYSVYHGICTAIAVVSVGHVLLAATLLYGVYRRSTAALRVWVWVMSALLLLSLLAAVLNAALTGVADTGSDMYLSFLLGVIFFAVLAYCILTVNSFYLLLKSSEDMSGPNTTPY